MWDDVYQRCYKWCYKALLFFTGKLPYSILALFSLPWCLVPIVAKRCYEKEEEDPHPPTNTTVSYGQPLLSVHKSMNVASNKLFWKSLGSIANLACAIVVICFTSAQLTEYHVIGFTYMLSFAAAALLRALMRQKYGPMAAESESIDNKMLAAFGIYLVQRGSTSLWIYPTLSLAPTAIVWSTFRWLQRLDFPVTCRPSADGRFALDQQHCALDSDASNYFHMAPFLASQLLLVYGITKAFAAFMVQADPDAHGTLSELQAWHMKMPSNMVGMNIVPSLPLPQKPPFWDAQQVNVSMPGWATTPLGQEKDIKLPGLGTPLGQEKDIKLPGLGTPLGQEKDIKFEFPAPIKSSHLPPTTQVTPLHRAADKGEWMFWTCCSASAELTTIPADVIAHEAGELGELQVRVIRAFNLKNMDSGYFGDVADPYVNLKLKSQDDRERKRTKTINNNLNPVWDSRDFTFKVYDKLDSLLLEVYDADIMKGDDFIGRLEIPLTKFIEYDNQRLTIRDRLQDIEQGELEVDVGFFRMIR